MVSLCDGRKGNPMHAVKEQVEVTLYMHACMHACGRADTDNPAAGFARRRCAWTRWTRLRRSGDREVRGILQSINDLAQIMKDLSVLVIDQGTILDRIDYNMEQARMHGHPSSLRSQSSAPWESLQPTCGFPASIVSWQRCWLTFRHAREHDEVHRSVMTRLISYRPSCTRMPCCVQVLGLQHP